MKFNPTLPLALALSVGAAGAVLAQTPPAQTPPAQTPTTPSTAYSQQPQMQAPTSQAPSAAARTPSTAQMQQRRPATAAPSMASGTAVNGNEQVRMAQQRLHAAGLYNGPEDGIMDPDTRAALARYQEQNGLQRSESLDPATLASLERSPTTASGSTMPPAEATPPGTPSAALNPYAGAVGANGGKSSAR